MEQPEIPVTVFDLAAASGFHPKSKGAAFPAWSSAEVKAQALDLSWSEGKGRGGQAGDWWRELECGALPGMAPVASPVSPLPTLPRCWA